MSTAQVNELKTVDGTKSVQVADIADGNVGIGVGQTWQYMTSQRELGVEYTNDTGRPIMVNVVVSNGVTAEQMNFKASVGAIEVCNFRINDSSGTHHYVTLSFIVPYGATYKVYTSSATTPELINWGELR